MSHIFDAFMFRNELEMLQCRLESMRGWSVTHVLVESPVTHRGVPKPLNYQNHTVLYRDWLQKVKRVEAELPDDVNPWVREHAQRNAAWKIIDERADDDDVVLICDVDEIPSQALLLWDGMTAQAVQMRTCIYAVDWEVTGNLPPTCVVAKVGYLRRRHKEGYGLAEVRDHRSEYSVLPGGGWHLSWLGGPEKQADKLNTATCHKELLASPEAELIRSGERYRTGADGGGLPVHGVDVDDSWPAYIAEHRCPPEWFRPRAA